MTRLAVVLFALMLGALATTNARALAPSREGFFPASAAQGSLVVVHLAPGSHARYADRDLRVAPDGTIAFGIGRDEKGPVTVEVSGHSGDHHRVTIEIIPRDWPVERIEGVPPQTVAPPPDIAARIRREQARVAAARTRDDARDDFEETFNWPVEGRISGRFGNRRVYVVNGADMPMAPHSGMDIAAPQGTPVKAPASGIVTFADPDLYLTGGTVLIDHGHGVSSNFLHLSRIDVKVGDRVGQGQVIGAVGRTGRATGPHLHWGMNWFDVRLDPLLLFERQRVAGAVDAPIELHGPTAVGYQRVRSDEEAADGATAAKTREESTAALEGIAGCARAQHFSLGTASVTGPLLTVREQGQPDVELVLPDALGAYLFWPGKKSGRNVVAESASTFGKQLAQASADYFELRGCSGA